MDVGGKSSLRWLHLVAGTVVALLGCGLIGLLPRFVGASWVAIGSTLGAVPPLVLCGLVLLWFAGLLVHVPVLRAAMPGLTTRQALTLNLSGSAVSNVLPVGGPAGMGLGYAMARSWGFGSDRFASYTVSTNLWNALGKFVVGLTVLATAALLDQRLPSGLGAVVIGASVFISVSAGLAALVLRTEGATAAAGRRLDRFRRRLRPRENPVAASEWLLNGRAELVTAVRAGWRRMSAGVLLYLALQASLMFACLAAVGAGAPITVVLIAFAIERLISLAPITPGASGVAELGTVAALHSFGVDPVHAAAGVLLYRILMFAIEIPVGGTIALSWLRGHRRRRAAEAQAALVIEPDRARTEVAA
ncbi:lysylphosphatidylglycerol synthase transmembrane domain-containing protein [Nocardioides marmorisolisilvae]|nr:lysylphosphatidylglycerol synthase transmembrane domain-containing protein [Nocardioides marmorisolisilvae]